jgi:hypothetical protein
MARATRLASAGSADRLRICASGRWSYRATTSRSQLVLSRARTGAILGRTEGGRPATTAWSERVGSSRAGVSSTAPAKPAAARKVRKGRLGRLSWFQPDGLELGEMVVPLSREECSDAGPGLRKKRAHSLSRKLTTAIQACGTRACSRVVKNFSAYKFAGDRCDLPPIGVPTSTIPAGPSWPDRTDRRKDHHRQCRNASVGSRESGGCRRSVRR